MRLLAIGLTALLAGCTASQEAYYAAHQAAVEAQAAEAKARYDALAQMASNGGETGAAAVMALALSGRQVSAPQYIEDPALKWASVLAAPIASLGALAIQADASKEIAKVGARTEVARIESNAQTQQTLYGALTRPQTVAPPSLGAEELGVVVDGLVTLGTNATGALVAVNDRGYDAVTDTTIAGYSTLADVSLAGLNTAEGINSVAVGALNTSHATSVGALVDTQQMGYGTFLSSQDRHLQTLDGSLDGFFTALENCNCFDITDGFTLTPDVTPDFSPSP